MIQTGIETRVKVQDIVSSQLPNFILDESPKAVDFLKQYYISQEYQGGSIDLSTNLDQYLNLDNLTPEVIVDSTSLSSAVSASDSTISVNSTKGFPKEYGIIKIDSEIITYTGITTNSFTGCVRGFSGITSYRSDLNNEEVVFSESSSVSHSSDSSVQNLSTLFLKEFYKKFKSSFAPGLENTEFTSSLNVGNFLKEIKSFYQSKGTNESFKILFKVLYGETPDVINLEERIIKPSFAEFKRREVSIARSISGNALLLKGQTLFQDETNSTASVSEITPFTIDGEIFYKVSLFVGYDEDSDIQGRFFSTPNSLCSETAPVGASILTVDSTVGFATSGKIISGSNTISYTDKTINQFLNCSGITDEISQYSIVHSDKTFYGYENGNTEKRVDLVFFSVIKEFIQEGNVEVEVNDPISIKSLGIKVKNPSGNKSYQEVFANSWIYNTNSAYFIETFDNSTLSLKTSIDSSSLKRGDAVEIVERGTGKVVQPSDAYPTIPRVDETSSIQGESSITLIGFSPESVIDGVEYNLRKILNKARLSTTSNLSIDQGNDTLISDIQNVYFDSEHGYVASNSLPSSTRNISGLPFAEDISASSKKVVANFSTGSGVLVDQNAVSGKYGAIELFTADGGSNIQSPFKTGDKIFYKPSGDSLIGLEEGQYFVENIGNSKIRLYGSNFLIETQKYLEYSLPESIDSDHNFILNSQKSEKVGAQKLLKKFPIPQKIVDGRSEENTTGEIGILKNGVEITSYKSVDKVYYGPIESIDVLNGGFNFDVINPPQISISSGISSTAHAQPVVSGSVKDVYVDFDAYNFNISNVVSIGVTGGNGKGCILRPSTSSSFREVVFSGKTTSNGGGINTSTNQIVFDNDHGFFDGQEVIYDSNLNTGIGINSIRNGPTNLISKSTYVVEVTNNVSVKLYENFDDYKVGINTLVFTGDSNAGSHKLKVGPLNVLRDIVVIDGGKGYTNKKLYVDSSSGISTENNWIHSKNHGFKDGEIIEYSSVNTSIIGGLNTSHRYFVIKIDEDKFRLASAGVGGTVFSNYQRKNYEEFYSKGVGYQIFSYPKIEVYLDVITSGVGQTTITVTPSVKGSIESVQVYDGGLGYGSSIVNYIKSPVITVNKGSDGRVSPIIVDGKIQNVSVEYGGEKYYSTPDIIAKDLSGSGTGAVLRAVIKDQRIDSVKVIKSGISYSSTDTVLEVVSSGQNEVLESNIRSLTLVNNEQYSDKLVLDNNEDKLKYSVCGYDISVFDESSSVISDIIGWAYDGNPIYGPYGSKNPEEFTTAERLLSGYVKDSSLVSDRPSLSDFAEGYFVEDYYFDGSGDLDEHNGRFEKNRDFPQGVYAYHATVDTSVNQNAPFFPYFIGDTFRSQKVTENFDNDFNQSFDFNNSDLLRNTLPYNISEKFGRNDFIEEQEDQEIVITSITSGSIDGVSVIGAGTSFKVGDLLSFDNTDTDGTGLNVKVSSIQGETINSIDTEEIKYTSATLTWGGDRVKVTLDTEHDFQTEDFVYISGISSESLSALSKYNKIIREKDVTGRSLSTITAGAASTEIYVSFIPDYVSAGSTIGIGTETMTVLNVYDESNVLRIERESGLSVISHEESSAIQFVSKSFIINQTTPFFESVPNEKVYFNASESVGIGTTAGTSYPVSFTFGSQTINRQIPVKGIYLENHPFKTNQKIKLTYPSGSVGKIEYAKTAGGTSEQLAAGDLFVVNQSKNVIGIKTTIDTDEVFFTGFSTPGSTDLDDYLFETTFTPVTVDVEQIKTTVSVSTSHNLKNNDKINLSVVPDISVGVGTTSTSVDLRYDSHINGLVINPISFTDAELSTTTDTITITDHNFKTGDKVLYKNNNGAYFIDASDQVNVNSDTPGPNGLYFKHDGTKMYVIGNTDSEINEYTLSTPWSPSTASFSESFDLSSQLTTPKGIYIKPDGKSFWVIGNTSDKVFEYSLSTAWDISTASYANRSYNVSTELSQTSPQDIFFKYDGTVMYIIGQTADRIYQINLSTAWDISTASYPGDSEGHLLIGSAQNGDTSPKGMSISPDGTLIYWVGTQNDNIYVWRCSTPWDITTASRVEKYETYIGSANPTAIYFKSEEELFVISGLFVKEYNRSSPTHNESYFVYKNDADTIKLAKTSLDLTGDPRFVGFNTTNGSDQTLSKINPEINVVKNNNLVFDVSDSSLEGYKVKFYYDNEFKNEFVSIGSTTEFIVTGVGTVGVSTDATVTVDSDENTPVQLFYNVEKSGYISTSDTEVFNSSSISFVKSVYDGEYKISGVANTTFELYLKNDPERFEYSSSDCDILKYSTTSKNVQGKIDGLSIISGGFGYKKTPSFVGSSSTIAKDATLVASSSNAGNINTVEIITDNYKYSHDRTLRPKALLPIVATVKDANTIDSIEIDNPGFGYVEAPSLIIVDKTTREKLNTGFLEASVGTQSIIGVNVLESPVGLPDGNVEIISVNNDNGFAIDEVESSAGAAFTCKLVTPITGFVNAPFAVNDEVFIEGITKYSSDGSGFNSEDYDYKFLKVKSIVSTNPFEMEFDVAGFTTSTGIAVTDTNRYARIINTKDYPSFDVTLKTSEFTIGENITVNDIKKDFKVIKTGKGKVTIFGDDTIKEGDSIKGNGSLSSAKIEKITENQGKFDIDFSYKANVGWENKTGKLNDDDQVVADNDYYQNLSYSVKSTKTWNEIKSPVNRLVHTSGLKNFADTTILSDTNIGIGSNNYTTVIADVISENRVDAINGLDNARDTDFTDKESNFVEFEKTRFIQFTEAKTNNVLTIDNINKQFSNLEGDPDQFLNIGVIENIQRYETFLARVKSNSYTEEQAQLSEFILIGNGSGDTVIFNKSSLVNAGLGYTTYSDDEFGEYKIEQNNEGVDYLRFVPTNPYDIDYDLKLIKTEFSSQSGGIGTESFGLIDLTSRTRTNLIPGEEEIITSVDTEKFESLYVVSKITDKNTGKMNILETYVTHDGQDSYIAEYYVGEAAGEQIGISSVKIESGNLVYSYVNDTSNNIKINSRIVGLGTTAAGNGQFRFKTDGQDDEDERSVLYEAFHGVGVGTTTIFTKSSSLFDAVKCSVEVSVGSSKALHQVTALHDGTNAFIQQSQYLANDYNAALTGLGTFSATYDSTNFIIQFHPDDNVGTTTFKAFNQAIYTLLDFANDPNTLNYGKITEDILLQEYNAINGSRINRTAFDAKHNGIDIFAKTFNPSGVITTSSAGISYTTFAVNDHFFRTGEELIYNPGSSFVGVGSTPMTYEHNGVGVAFTSTVFAIRINDDSFGLATTRANANAGLGVTILSYGEGNAHVLEMSKSNTKALISIDGLVQYPLIDTKVRHTLEYNGATGIGTTQTLFSLSGISSLSVANVLKIDDEYFRVDNVGVGTSISGPITPGIGTFFLVDTKRGIVGSAATDHASGSTVEVYQGSYHIEKSKLHFTESPRGNPQGEDMNGLPFPRSKFSGRVYLRNDYSSNLIYDDISSQFTGIKSEFTITVGGANTTGIGTSGGNGILFINGIFQTPETDNNSQQNYTIEEDTTAGVTSVRFSGMYVNDDSTDYIDENDVNTNQLPRGGVPISIGSTVGLGFAPLITANVRAVIGAGGSIESIVGVATTGTSVSISTATYDEKTGILSVTTNSDHGLIFGDQNNDEVRLEGLEFSCPGGSGITTTIFPDKDVKDYSVIGVSSSQTFQVNVGISTIVHTYVGQGTVTPYYGNLNLGSGYNGLVSIAVTVFESGHSGNIATITAAPIGFNTHIFVSAESNAIDGSITPQSGTTYNPQTGILSVTASSHGLTTGDLVTITDESLTFTCAQDNHTTTHKYPRSTDPVSGVSTAVTVVNTNKFTVDVGKSAYGSGGRLKFTIEGDGGSGYTNPRILVSEPSYSNLDIIGISRLGIGSTSVTGVGLSISVNVGPSTDPTGLRTDLFGTNTFNITKNGYAFQIGDKFTPVGLVTSRLLHSVQSQFELEVTQAFSDKFALWQYGEVDFIDSIKDLQNGERTRFPLKYNNELISVEASDNFDIDLAPLLLIFRNRVIQNPDETYEFVGGTSVNFKDAPEPDDDIQIFFYKGTDGVDSVLTDPPPRPIELGDEIKILADPAQNFRTLSEFTNSDTLKTNLYRGVGITSDFEPIIVHKQKYDKFIDGVAITKDREQLRPRIFPTAKVISGFGTDDKQFFIDDASLFFNEEEEVSPDFNIIITNGQESPVAAAVTAVVSSTGTISSLNIEDSGSGYGDASTADITILSPSEGTTATATASISGGELSSVTITNVGSGYSQLHPPQVIVSLPAISAEIVTGITSIRVNSGVLTGIGTTVAGSQLAVKFTGVSTQPYDSNVLKVGNPIYIFDTETGAGVTSVDGSDANIIGIGTTNLDNIYIIKEFSSSGVGPYVGIITCEIDSGTDVSDISSLVGFTTDPIGRFSVGILTGTDVSRSDTPIGIAVSGFTINSGLTTFPTIQRRTKLT